MKTIVIDTSNNYLAIGLFIDGHLVEKKASIAAKQQSELAIPWIEEILLAHHLVLKEIDEIVVSIGPGSYTGVRIGLTIAKVLAAIVPIKVKAVSSLALLASEGKTISYIDARSNKFFVAMYENKNLIGTEMLLDSEAFEKFKQEHLDYEAVTYNDDIDLCHNLYELGKKASVIVDVDSLVPSYIKEIEAKKQCL